MKRFLAAVLLMAMLLLSACAGKAESTLEPTPTPEPEYTFQFTRENFPRLDGSTSLVPLGKAVAAVLLGEDTESVADLIHFNRTSQSFRNLMYGGCDLLISGEPAGSVWEECEAQGFKYERAHIATDALIFVVSADNPVDSLTPDQIRGIYSGEITNWAQVGGDDVEITPFQRNAEAGSQAAMQRLVMGDTPLMEPPSDHIVDSMMGLMEAVRNFDGSTGAIGYSVYYYANDMRMAQGLKILAVDGVDPEPETIRSKEYPFLANSYTVIAADTPKDSPARILYDWLQGEEGQYLIREMGYVPVMELPEKEA